ncbi:BACON domain-containing protein [Coraliomargarita sp. SDUM461003]|uniref:BACON domain-containing protein n=1 Tax=Thalassobacterium maritimum TaxID=3041265 RepID=A0ABU1AZS4_9BACT|nr:BACON domain-containing protein [Coraliomargarita sp. SDUM461003]MDQ8209628.1 BACON domain-containing protein [Coraliomargarita sp. SDUM461003]
MNKRLITLLTISCFCSLQFVNAQSVFDVDWSGRWTGEWTSSVLFNSGEIDINLTDNYYYITGRVNTLDANVPPVGEGSAYDGSIYGGIDFHTGLPDFEVSALVNLSTPPFYSAGVRIRYIADSFNEREYVPGFTDLLDIISGTYEITQENDPSNILDYGTFDLDRIAVSTSLVPYLKPVTSIAGSYTINVASNTSWVVSESHAWISVSRTSGSGNNTITITYTENYSDSTRIGFIDIGTETHTITQSAGWNDQNGDGVDDNWASSYFSKQFDPNADTDGDGLTHAEESRLKSNPFLITRLISTPEFNELGKPVITMLEMKPVGTYILLHRVSLNEGTWTELARWTDPEFVQNLAYTHINQTEDSGFYALKFEAPDD